MSFREEVYAAVRKIKPGRVATYGEVAASSGYRVKEKPWKNGMKQRDE